MTNLLSFNLFKTKSFKAISLALALSLTSSLMVVTNHQSNINAVNDSSKLSGFHITVKENNKNLISEANTWNLINNKYEDFIRIHDRIHDDQLITEQFNDWSDIINQVQIKPNDDIFSKDVNSHFTEQIKNKENHILPDKGEQYFTNNIVGRSVAKQSLNGITSFGNVYVGYHDDTLPAQISNGLFATINPKADFNNYFSIPYMIKPSTQFLNNHQNIQDRVAILPLNNANPNDTNQSMLVILAKTSNDEQLQIDNDNVSIVNTDAVSYAVLNHKPSDGLNVTTFHINVKGTDFSKTINLTNNSSNLQFVAANSEYSTVTTQYLIQNNSQTNQNTLVVMNKIAEEAKVNINNHQQQWLKWRVDSQTLQKVKDDHGTPIKDGDTLSLSQESDFQVYCIGLDTTDVQRQTASEQYIIVYRNATKVASFVNCTDFFQDINNKPSTLLAGFQQYLTSATNNSIKVEDLKNNAGEFLSWFIQYQGVITKQSYVNYLQSNNTDNPWDVNMNLSSRTLVNNWNVIIICGFIFSLLIVIPIVIVIFRKKKYLK